MLLSIREHLLEECACLKSWGNFCVKGPFMCTKFKLVSMCLSQDIQSKIPRTFINAFLNVSRLYLILQSPFRLRISESQ